MARLRALLRFKKDGNSNSDGQDSARRQVEQAPVTKDALIPPGNAPTPTNVAQDVPQNGSLDMSEYTPQESTASRNLWKEAYDGLPLQLQELLPASVISPEDAIEGIIGTTKQKYEEWQKGGLRVHRKSGNDIDIREACERIIGVAMKTKDIVSKVVSFDPTGHASSAWTIVSFGMSIVQNRLDRRDAVFEASEFLTENMAYFALIDANYRDQGAGSDPNIDNALLQVYSAILEFTAEVKETRDENEATRLRNSIFAFTDQPLSALKTVVIKQKKAVQEWAWLASNLGDRERAKDLLTKTDELIERSKNVESKLTSAEEEDQLEWISSAKYSARQEFLQPKRTGDTGVWFLDSYEYHSWISSPGSLLWVTGISGCGKSVLCSTVVRDLDEICDLNPSKHYAYWYFDFGSDATQSVDALMRSLIRQLCQPPLPSSVVNLWKKHHLRGDQPDSGTIRRVFDDVLSRIPKQHHVYLVFDALDECPNNNYPSQRESLLSLLENLVRQYNDKLHILAFSRPETDISQRLGGFPKIDLEAHIAEDVQTHVEEALSRRLGTWDEGIRELIRQKLLSFKERRFRWAELQIEALSKQYDEPSLKKALDSVPATLEGTYRAILDKIEPQNVSKAREIFLLICLSPISLDVSDVAQMIGLYSADWVVTICTTSLVSLNGSKIQMAHFSVQEYLTVSEKTSDHHECQFTVIDGHKHLAEKAAELLLAQNEPLTRQEGIKLRPFLYAAQHWNFHMFAAGRYDNLSAEIQAKIDRLFAEPIVYLNWLRAADAPDSSDNEWAKSLKDLNSPILRATQLDLANTVRLLASQSADPSHFRQFSTVDRGGEFHREWNIFFQAAHLGRLDVLYELLNLGLTVAKSEVKEILENIDYREAGKVKLAKVLHTMRDQGLFHWHEDEPLAIGAINQSLLFRSTLNSDSGFEIFTVFLSWPTISISVTEDLLESSFKRSHSDNLPRLLIEKFNLDIPSCFKEPDFEFDDFEPVGFAYLALERPNEMPISEDLLRLFARKGSSAMIQSLLRSRKRDIQVTTSVLEAAAMNERDRDIMVLLWGHREPESQITDKMIANAVANEVHSSKLIPFILREPGAKLELSIEATRILLIGGQDGVGTLKMLLSFPSLGPPVPEPIIASICYHLEAVEMLRLLEKEKGFKGPITEMIFEAAALNESCGTSLIGYLAQLSRDPLIITENVLIKAAQNGERGHEIITTFERHISDSSFTDGVFEAAYLNKKAMLALFDQRRRSPPMDAILTKLVHSTNGSFHDSRKLKDVFQAIVERGLVDVNESLVNRMVGNFHCLDALLAWKPNAPITEATLLRAITDQRKLRVIFAAHGDPLPVTERFLLYAVKYSTLPIMEAILHRQKSLHITENLILAAAGCASDGEIVEWLLNQQAESLVTNLDASS